MPIVKVETNLKYSQMADNFGPKLSKCVSETLNKPEERITISLATECRMWRNGSDSPMVHVHISAIDAVSTATQNTVHAQRLTKFLEETTGIPTDRIFLLFTPIESWQIGKNGQVTA